MTLNGVRIGNAPQHLLPGGGRGGSTRHLLAYLRAQLRHCVPYNRMKLMVVGLQGRGKTTLLSVLRNPSCSLPENVSTVGVVVNDWTVAPPITGKGKKNLGAKVRTHPIGRISKRADLLSPCSRPTLLRWKSSSAFGTWQVKRYTMPLTSAFSPAIPSTWSSGVWKKGIKELTTSDHGFSIYR